MLGQFTAALVAALFLVTPAMANPKPIVIAHRGASGYLPEHTLAAKAMAHAMGADFLEQDVVLTRDGIPIVLHDVYLESTTNVEQVFPGRARDDGRYYAMDFNLLEVQQLKVHERLLQKLQGAVPAYPQRFPPEMTLFNVPTLAQEIDLIAGLDRSRSRRTGLYIEFKAPNLHRKAGLDMVKAVLDVLETKGYADKPEQVFLQCFDDQTLRHLRLEIKTPLPLIQLIGENDWGEDSAVDYDYLKTNAGLAEVATYADGIGPWIEQIYLGKSADGKPLLSELVTRAKEQGLQVHPYTFRRDDLPAGIDTFDELLSLFVDTAKIDGLFTDFPDLVRDFLDQRAEQQ
jgi:glycerophosphoryl diester phosphodiesterase